jgi:hypothetical protein
LYVGGRFEQAGFHDSVEHRAVEREGVVSGGRRLRG